MAKSIPCSTVASLDTESRVVAVWGVGVSKPRPQGRPCLGEFLIPLYCKSRVVCIHTCPWHDGVFDQGLDGLLLHVGQEIAHHLTATLQHPNDGRSFLLQGATTSFALETASTSLALRALDHLWLA